MKTIPTINERAWAADLISEINLLSQSRRRTIRRAGGEWGVAGTSGKNAVFPDVLLFGDPAHNAALQGWELKMPDTPVTNELLLGNAQEKSARMGLSSFLVWNAADAALYRVDDGIRKVVKTWHCENISNRRDVWHKRSTWVKVLETILNDLNDYFEQGMLPRSKPLPLQLNDAIASMLADWTGALMDPLEDEERKSQKWRMAISEWWRRAKGEHGHPDEQGKFRILATEILLHWIHRFLFAHYLKRFVTEANGVDQLRKGSSIQNANMFFRRVSRRHDFAQLFQPRLGAELLPPTVWNALLEFNGYLTDMRLPDIKQSLLQETLQTVRQESQRKISGQFCTPELIASLLSKLTMDNLNDPVLDPCCGTGTIARAAFSYKLKHGLGFPDAVKTIWASDKYSMPLQFATLSLSSGDAPFETLRIFQHDVLTLRTGKPVSFIDAGTGKSFKEKLPAFPCVILNPPFIRFEDWMHDDPSFAETRDYVKKATGECIDARSDYFVPVLLHLWRLTTDGGRVGAIFSNAWLGADWGISFRKILRNFFSIECVVTSGAGRWFSNADVIVNIVVLKRRKTIGNQSPKEHMSFAVTQSPLTAWTEDLTTSLADLIVAKKKIISKKVRVHRISSTDMDWLDASGLCWTAGFTDWRWLKTTDPHMIRASTLFDINRGERRGWDALFYPPTDSGIEQEYLYPVLKSAADVKGFSACANGKAFCCSQSTTALQRKGHSGALAWIHKFEQASNGKGKPLTQTLARKGLFWYEMRPDAMADLAVSMNPDKRLFFIRLNPRAFVNQRLIRLTAKESVDLPLCHALLCSLTGCFHIEALGFGRGLGVLDLNATKLSRQMKMLNPALVSKTDRKKILSAFNKMLQRKPLPLTEEIQHPTRIAFEQTVFKSFGLEKIFPKAKKSVLELHRIRAAARDQ